MWRKKRETWRRSAFHDRVQKNTKSSKRIFLLKIAFSEDHFFLFVLLFVFYFLKKSSIESIRWKLVSPCCCSDRGNRLSQFVFFNIAKLNKTKTSLYIFFCAIFSSWSWGSNAQRTFKDQSLFFDTLRSLLRNYPRTYCIFV